MLNFNNFNTFVILKKLTPCDLMIRNKKSLMFSALYGWIFLEVEIYRKGKKHFQYDFDQFLLIDHERENIHGGTISRVVLPTSI